MKVFYISTNQHRIYHYLNESIIQAFYQMNVPLFVCQRETPIGQLAEFLHEQNKPVLALTLIGDLPNNLINFLQKNEIKSVVWLTEDPFYIDQSLQIMKSFDFRFTIDSGAYDYYQKQGISQIYHLPLGTNTSIFSEKKVDPFYESDVLLVGYPYPTRVQLVKFLLECGNFSITVIGKEWHNFIPKRFRKHKNIRIINQWIEPIEVSKFYNGAKIVLNSHRNPRFTFYHNKQLIQNRTMNNRTFDIAACGRFQLINPLSELRNYFTEEEMITYENEQDCLEKIHYYLENENIRQLIAKKAQLKVVQCHTFRHRLEEIMSIIQQKI